MNQKFLHEMTVAELRDALAERFPEHGAVVFLNINYDCQFHGNPSWSAELKFGRSGVSSGDLIKIKYAERFGDLCDSLRQELKSSQKKVGTLSSGPSM